MSATRYVRQKRIQMCPPQDWTLYHMWSAYDYATDIWRYVNVYLLLFIILYVRENTKKQCPPYILASISFAFCA